jgi:hypothetical protein
VVIYLSEFRTAKAKKANKGRGRRKKEKKKGRRKTEEEEGGGRENLFAWR